MPRTLRTKSSTSIYHVVLRGINKQEIFYDDVDNRKFLKEIERTKEKFNYKIYAYCLMPNHIHMVIKDADNSLGKIMQSLTVSYASYFNKKYERTGHLFQNRYISKNVETMEYLLDVQRYVHQNPAKAVICKTKEYKWSSYSSYLGESKLVDTGLVLSYLSKNKQDQHKKFIEFNRLKENRMDDSEVLEYEIRTSLTDEEAIMIIKQRFNINNIMWIQKYNSSEQKRVIKKLKQIKGISNNQISRITGINKRFIERIKE